MRRSYFKRKATKPLKIKLTKGKYAIIDAEDLDKIKDFKWWAYDGKKYAVSQKNRKSIKMHRIILETPKTKYTDHINNNGLDNRKCNLRICNGSQNKYNMGPKRNNTSGYKGIGWDKIHNKWRMRISVNKKVIATRYSDNKEKLALIYNELAKKHHGEFAKLNTI